ncbi:MAG TPA: hypothetical protein VG938_17895 [Verrucomicrobiae bacterium]|nr:hypothetical protein [Verrucomicrobiae bacterium]
MHQRRFIALGLLLCALLSGIARADTFQLNDGSTLAGDIISANENGMRVRQPDGTYSETVPWTKFSQDDLKKLAKDPKMEPFVTPNIEVTEEQRIQKTEVSVTQPPRLKRPPPGSLFGALLSSTVGLFVIVVLYGAVIYAAYEVALFRRRQPGLVCGLAAVPGLGLLSPIIFLWLPPQRLSNQEEEAYQAETTVTEAPSFVVPGTPAATPEGAPATPTESGGLKLHHDAPAAATQLPPTQVFQRGAFTFNRRFFETKFSGFFGVVRRDADKDMVLVIKAARGEYVAERISRISTNDFHAQVRTAHATQEVMIPFTEIQEVKLKHKDSP